MNQLDSKMGNIFFVTHPVSNTTASTGGAFRYFPLYAAGGCLAMQMELREKMPHILTGKDAPWRHAWLLSFLVPIEGPSFPNG